MAQLGRNPQRVRKDQGRTDFAARIFYIYFSEEILIRLHPWFYSVVVSTVDFDNKILRIPQTPVRTRVGPLFLLFEDQ